MGRGVWVGGRLGVRGSWGGLRGFGGVGGAWGSWKVGLGLGLGGGFEAMWFWAGGRVDISACLFRVWLFEGVEFDK